MVSCAALCKWILAGLQDPASLKAQLQQLGEQQERLQERTGKARAKAQLVPQASELLVRLAEQTFKPAAVPRAELSSIESGLAGLQP